MNSINSDIRALQTAILFINRLSNSSNIGKSIIDLTGANYKINEENISKKIETLSQQPLSNQSLNENIFAIKTKWGELKGKITSAIQNNETLSPEIQESMKAINTLVQAALAQSLPTLLAQEPGAEKPCPYHALMRPEVKKQLSLCLPKNAEEEAKRKPHFFVALENLLSHILDPTADSYYGKHIEEQFTSGVLLAQEQLLLLLLIDLVFSKQDIRNVEVFASLSDEDLKKLQETPFSREAVTRYFSQKEHKNDLPCHEILMNLVSAARTKESHEFAPVIAYLRHYFRPEAAAIISLGATGVSKDILKALVDASQWEDISIMIDLMNIKATRELKEILKKLPASFVRQTLPSVCLQMAKQNHPLAIDIIKESIKKLSDAESEDDDSDSDDFDEDEFIMAAARAFASHHIDKALEFASSFTKFQKKRAMHEIVLILMNSDPKRALSFVDKHYERARLAEVIQRLLQYGLERALSLIDEQNLLLPETIKTELVARFIATHTLENGEEIEQCIKTHIDLSSEKNRQILIDACSKENTIACFKKIITMFPETSEHHDSYWATFAGGLKTPLLSVLPVLENIKDHTLFLKTLKKVVENNPISLEEAEVTSLLALVQKEVYKENPQLQRVLQTSVQRYSQFASDKAWDFALAMKNGVDKILTFSLLCHYTPPQELLPRLAGVLKVVDEVLPPQHVTDSDLSIRQGVLGDLVLALAKDYPTEVGQLIDREAHPTVKEHLTSLAQRRPLQEEESSSVEEDDEESAGFKELKELITNSSELTPEHFLELLQTLGIPEYMLIAHLCGTKQKEGLFKLVLDNADDHFRDNYIRNFVRGWAENSEHPLTEIIPFVKQQEDIDHADLLSCVVSYCYFNNKAIPIEDVTNVIDIFQNREERSEYCRQLFNSLTINIFTHDIVDEKMVWKMYDAFPESRNDLLRLILMKIETKPNLLEELAKRAEGILSLPAKHLVKHKNAVESLLPLVAEDVRKGLEEGLKKATSEQRTSSSESDSDSDLNSVITVVDDDNSSSSS